MPQTPVWREIYDALRADIRAGRYRTGDRLPTEKDLSERFAVNRHTVRRALADLTSEGVIHVRRGSGAYVAEGVIDYPLGSSVKFSQNISQLGRTPTHRLLRAAIMPAEDIVAHHLRLGRDDRAVLIETVSEADGLPINHAEHFLPEKRFPDLIARFEESHSLTAALRHYGVLDYERAWTRITARAPSRLVASRLQQPETHPILWSEGVNLDMAGAPIEYARVAWAGHRCQFVVGNPAGR